MEKVRIVFTVPVELKDRFRREAKERSINVSELLRQWVEAQVTAWERNPGL